MAVIGVGSEIVSRNSLIYWELTGKPSTFSIFVTIPNNEARKINAIAVNSLNFEQGSTFAFQGTLIT